jgi:3,4-dihydroxy 2-butanone 4-phosphate synthase/GTP cyclohydrolase II
MIKSLPHSLPHTAFRRVEWATQALRAGRPIVLVDDVHGDDEGLLVAAAEGVTTQLVAFLVRHTSGFLCVALPENDCDRLDLPPLRPSPAAGALRDAFCATVDAVTGIGTGDISLRSCTHDACPCQLDGQRNGFLPPGSRHTDPSARRRCFGAAWASRSGIRPCTVSGPPADQRFRPVG